MSHRSWEADWARDHSDETHAAERLSYLALVEFHAGRCDLAERLIDQSCNTIEERLDVSGRFAYPFAWRSLMDAYSGRFDRARQTLLSLVAETSIVEQSNGERRRRPSHRPRRSSSVWGR